MLPLKHLLIATIVFLSSALAQYSLYHPSVFLSAEQLSGITTTTNQIMCEYTITANGKSEKFREKISTLSAISMLKEHERMQQKFTLNQPVSQSSKDNNTNSKKANIVTIGTRSGGYNSDIAMYVSAEGSNIQFMEFPSSTGPKQLLCFEYFGMQRRYDVYTPLASLTAHSQLTQYHDVVFLERHFGIPFAMPPHDIVETFSDKGEFASWMKEHGFLLFIPTTYHTFDEAMLHMPVVVKYTRGQGGKGIYLCHDEDALTRAVQAEGSQPYIIQETIDSRYEVVQEFVAFRGKLLGVRTALVAMANGTFITTSEGDIAQSYAVDDTSFNEIAPVTTLLLRMVAESGYSGIGNIQYKLAPGLSSIDDTENAIEHLTRYSLNDPSTFRSDFSQLADSLYHKAMNSIPKVIKVNPRSAGPIRDKSNARYIDFLLKAYIAELANVD